MLSLSKHLCRVLLQAVSQRDPWPAWESFLHRKTCLWLHAIITLGRLDSVYEREAHVRGAQYALTFLTFGLLPPVHCLPPCLKLYWHFPPWADID